MGEVEAALANISVGNCGVAPPRQRLRPERVPGDADVVVDPLYVIVPRADGHGREGDGLRDLLRDGDTNLVLAVVLEATLEYDRHGQEEGEPKVWWPCSRRSFRSSFVRVTRLRLVNAPFYACISVSV